MINDAANSKGSEPRTVGVLISSSDQIRSSINLRHKRPGVGGWLTQLFQGWQLRKSVGDLVRKLRRIDRQNDRYVEHVETNDGTALRDCDEPLSSHRDHGSAKARSCVPSRGEACGLTPRQIAPRQFPRAVGEGMTTQGMRSAVRQA
jgi:hypothetical protein